MTGADDPEDLGMFDTTSRDGRMPKLVIVAIVWAGFGAVGLLTALLMRSAGIAVFGVLCVLAGGALYLGQRAREHLERDENLQGLDSWDAPEDGEEPDGEQPPPSPPASDDPAATTVFGSHPHDDDIVDAEFTEYFDYDQAPADQDDGTGYDEEELAYQRYQADRRAREAEDEDEAQAADSPTEDGAQAADSPAEDGARATTYEPGDAVPDRGVDDEARTERIPAGATGPDERSDDGSGRGHR